MQKTARMLTAHRQVLIGGNEVFPTWGTGEMEVKCTADSSVAAKIGGELPGTLKRATDTGHSNL